MKEFRRIFYILIYDIHCNHDPMQSLSLLCNVLFGWIIFLTEGYLWIVKTISFISHCWILYLSMHRSKIYANIKIFDHKTNKWNWFLWMGKKDIDVYSSFILFSLLLLKLIVYDYCNLNLFIYKVRKLIIIYEWRYRKFEILSLSCCITIEYHRFG